MHCWSPIWTVAPFTDDIKFVPVRIMFTSPVPVIALGTTLVNVGVTELENEKVHTPLKCLQTAMTGDPVAARMVTSTVLAPAA